MADTHYVLVIHGTWNPPNPTSPTWHQLNESDPQNFCTKLNDELERLGFGRPVWRQVDTQETSFGWSGANQDDDRQRAGERLCELITHIVDRDPSARIHFVAHSHGANVLLYALSLYLKTLRKEASVIVDEAYSAADLIDAQRHGRGIKPQILRELLEHFGKTRIFHIVARNIRKLRRDPISLLKALESIVGGKIGQDAAQRLIQSLPEPIRRRLLPSPPAFSETTFADMWMTFNACNRIGRLVFLGPPFFKKTWIRGVWWGLGSSLGGALNYMSAMFLGLITAFMAFEVMWTEVWLIGSLLQLVFHFDGDLRPQLDPRSWSTWQLVVGGLLAIVYTITLCRDSDYRGKRRDLNPYFQIENVAPCLAEVSPWFPFRTQVIHAGLLDEALLGYSAEPLVYGALAPQVQSLLRSRLLLRVERPQVGEGFSPSSTFARYVALPLRSLLWVVTKAAFPVGGILERRLVKTLLQIISSPAYGLPVREFSNAVYMTSHKIEQPQWFMETAWDVGKVLLASAPKRDSSGHAWITRYRFLWDDAEREKRMKSSWLRDQLQAQIPTILARYRGLPNVDTAMLQDRIINTSLVLEERVKEIIGAVELMHSSYYTNDTVIRGIARFIATGKTESD